MRPLRACVAAVLCVALLAPAAPADEALFLAWNDCPTAPGASGVRVSACADNAGQNLLYAAFSLATPVDSVLGVEIVVDLQTTASAIPEWWRFDGIGCRYASLHADGNYGTLAPCEDLWGALLPSGTLQSYVVTMPRGGDNQARIRVALGIVTPAGLDLTPGPLYLAARLVIDNLKTVDPGACPGCGDGVCLVLNSIILKRPLRPPGAPTGDVLLTQPGPAAANWAIWQGGTTTQCQAVPVRPRTWGEVKSLYR